MKTYTIRVALIEFAELEVKAKDRHEATIKAQKEIYSSYDNIERLEEFTEEIVSVEEKQGD